MSAVPVGGIITAIELLRQRKVFEEFKPDVVIYDVLGDVVCGGFGIPIREGVAEQVYTVSSSDFMAIYAANNLFKGIKKYSNSGGALFSGIIANSTNLPIQREIIEDFAASTKTTIAEYVPRSLTVTKSELQGKTVIEGAPESEQADVYRVLAKKILSNQDRYVPAPLDTDQLKDWAESWSDKAAGGAGFPDPCEVRTRMYCPRCRADYCKITLPENPYDKSAYPAQNCQSKRIIFLTKDPPPQKVRSIKGSHLIPSLLGWICCVCG